MPTSHAGKILPIVSLVQAIDPNRVLDVGFGFGRYGFLCREVLEERSPSGGFPSGWHRTIDGIEAWEPYIGELQRHIYDEVHVGEAVPLIKGMPHRSYDLVLLIEIIEHLDKEDGRQLLEEALRVGDVVLVSTPLHFLSQGPAFGNPFEVHRSHWRASDLRAVAPRAMVVLAPPALIGVLSRTGSLPRMGLGWRLYFGWLAYQLMPIHWLARQWARLRSQPAGD